MSARPRTIPRWQRWALSIAGRSLLMAAGWWALTGGDFHYWGLALALIGAAVGASLLVVEPGDRRWHPLAVVRFAAFFAYQSLLGGIDVAKRAFDPRMPIQPGVVKHRLHTATPLGEVLIADTVSLLPGTVGMDLKNGELTLHVLDTRMPVEATLRKLEERVADLLDEKPGQHPDA